MEKRKIYVIGVGADIKAVELAKKILELENNNNIEIICVENENDIPADVRFLSDASKIRHIFKLEAPIKSIINPQFFYEKKHKGHERPYKFHK